MEVVISILDPQVSVNFSVLLCNALLGLPYLSSVDQFEGPVKIGLGHLDLLRVEGYVSDVDLVTQF
jgi:hypothetical protein